MRENIRGIFVLNKKVDVFGIMQNKNQKLGSAKRGELILSKPFPIDLSSDFVFL